MATPRFYVSIHSCNLLIMMYNEYIESKVLPIEKRGTAMRSKSPELMKEICQYAEQYYLQNGISPSTTKIAEEVGVSRGTVYKYLVAMNDRGMIEYDGHDIQTDVTRKLNTETSQTAIVGSVPCGSPQYEEENIEEYISLPTAIFGKGDFYILHASGDSMVDAGIDDGDLVVIRKQNYS